MLHILILNLYQDYYSDKEIAYAMFVEQAKLLWMRRHVGEDDVLNWFKEIGVL